MPRKKKEPWKAPKGAKRIRIGPFDKEPYALAIQWGLEYADPEGLTDFHITGINKGLSIARYYLYFTDHDRSRWSQWENPINIEWRRY